MAHGSGAPDPHASASAGKKSHALIRGLQAAWRTWLAVALAAVAGIPAAVLAAGFGFVPVLIARELHLPNDAVYLFEVAVDAYMSITLLFIVLIIIPSAWRHMSNPSTLRAAAYIAIQALAVGLGLVVPPHLNGWILTWVLAAAGTAGWWAWQQRWRGTGVAPSPLSGILRPEIHPGQLWFAVIQGRHETKIRPVLVLNPDVENPKRWIVAYFTTQEPRTDHLKTMYLPVPTGTLRGIAKDNWLSLKDPRSLTRSQFRTYTGLTPTWLYNAACEAYGMAPNLLARTIEEVSAGAAKSAFEFSLRRALGMDRHTPSAETFSWEATQALLKLQIGNKPAVGRPAGTHPAVEAAPTTTSTDGQ